uniref:Uncharacterized protein n=1 Tax=Timema bartmani TaxID=61472 RepID=A0A7R9F118_9NEOP|nr:unnamed protein product [Timema bartmani]
MEARTLAWIGSETSSPDRNGTNRRFFFLSIGIGIGIGIGINAHNSHHYLLFNVLEGWGRGGFLSGDRPWGYPPSITLSTLSSESPSSNNTESRERERERERERSTNFRQTDKRASERASDWVAKLASVRARAELDIVLEKTYCGNVNFHWLLLSSEHGLGGLYLEEVYLHLHDGIVENYFGKTTLSLLEGDSNLNDSIFSSLVYCKSSALDHAAIEEDRNYHRLMLTSLVISKLSRFLSFNGFSKNLKVNSAGRNSYVALKLLGHKSPVSLEVNNSCGRSSLAAPRATTNHGLCHMGLGAVILAGTKGRHTRLDGADRARRGLVSPIFQQRGGVPRLSPAATLVLVACLLHHRKEMGEKKKKITDKECGLHWSEYERKLDRKSEK